MGRTEIFSRSLFGEQNGLYDLILTDPPYYDAIPYSDLMDFFYTGLETQPSIPG